MREKLVSELVKEVLGPRTNNIREVMSISPSSEFITGVLAPKQLQETQDIDDELDIPTEDTQIYEGEDSESEIDSLPVFQPALDPKSKPATMGLSFVVEYSDKPKIDVCLTWARYKSIEDKNGKVAEWRRHPRYAILSIDLQKAAIFKLDENGQITGKNEEISFHVKIYSLSNKSTLVHLYIVNELPNPSDSMLISDYCIYQPQIRVSKGNTQIIQGIRKKPTGKEEQTLELLYKNRPIYARGHLCSAVWKNVDPQIKPLADIGNVFVEKSKSVPFYWIDGDLLVEYGLQSQHTLFSSSDVRTEYVPLYTIANPNLDWPMNFKEAPELKASALSQIWTFDEINSAFLPITREFEQWISNLEIKTADYSDEEKILAYELIAQCKTVLDRIKDGINILCTDEEARLAFCFANKAIAVQGYWSRKTEFVWRPFQIAFILMTIESTINPKSKYNNVCDILWVPTGTGKTEAYLALTAFVISYRRRKAQNKLNQDLTGAGVSVITRYTLRLLTIQQFRRTLAMVTACEYLRVHNLGAKTSVGWRPNKCDKKNQFLWGSTPFSCGLWVGGSVSPNRLRDTFLPQSYHSIPGALAILEGDRGEGDPAQVLNCPACGTTLAVPEIGLQAGTHEIHLIVKLVAGDLRLVIGALTDKTFNSTTLVGAPRIFALETPTFYTLSLNLNISNALIPRDFDSLWESIQSLIFSIGVKIELASIRPSRNGYFERSYRSSKKVGYDFETICPNPHCELNRIWVGGLPSGWIADNNPQTLAPTPDGHNIPCFPDGNTLVDIQEPFRKAGNMHISNRIPIPAVTVEDQVFSRLPSVIVATVDKFARPPFKPEAAGLFGNVQFHNNIHGYYRKTTKMQTPAGRSQKLPYSLDSPDLIIQDELHLIEGPLGSLVGLYETAIDYLCKENSCNSVKYIASTATIRRAQDQTQALFCRTIQIFPPHGLTANDKFYLNDSEMHALDDKSAGRLYLGICAPGRGPLTPLVRIYSRLLFTVGKMSSDPSIDDFWTLTGYFNAIRELGGARALYRQDIPQRLHKIAETEGLSPRLLDDDNAIELSSRRDATDLPAILRILEQSHYPNAPDALFTTSMFGTGIDVSRINLMVVNGQPKTTSSYIQSTGRVGRRKAALVVTFLRASRPRDLNHYEFFVGYHRQLHRYVEPATVYPFSPGALERALGPVMVFILRSMKNCSIDWSLNDSASLMATQLTKAPEVIQLPALFEKRAQGQPFLKRPLPTRVAKLAESKLAVWHSVAVLAKTLKYNEYTQVNNPVVLGDYKHLHSDKDIVYENAPQSLRDIEETTSFQTRG